MEIFKVRNSLINLISYLCVTHLFFQLYIPVNFLKRVVIPETIKKLDSTKTQQLTISDVFVFLGCIFSWNDMR